MCGLYVNQVDAKGAILGHPDALDHAVRLGRALADPTIPLPARPEDVSLF